MKKFSPYPAHTLIIQPEVLATVTRHPNDDLLIQWQKPASHVTIYARTSPEETADQQFITTVTDEQEALITDLDPKQRYYFQLDFGNGRCLTTAERTLPLQEAVNFRDMGGYKTEDGRSTKWGQLYRAGNLHNLTHFDQQYLDGLGLKLVCDLRSLRVSHKRPDRFLPDPQRQHRHFPMKNPSRTFSLRTLWALLFQPSHLEKLMLDGYIHLAIEKNTAVIYNTLAPLADPQNLPMLIHCAAGKDRTGIIIALLLSLLGVPESTILADYSLSNAYYAQFAQAIAEDIRPLLRLGLSTHAFYPLHIARPQTLIDTFAHIRQKYGSIPSYLQDTVGFEPATISQIQQNLLE